MVLTWSPISWWKLTVELPLKIHREFLHYLKQRFLGIKFEDASLIKLIVNLCGRRFIITNKLFCLYSWMAKVAGWLTKLMVYGFKNDNGWSMCNELFLMMRWCFIAFSVSFFNVPHQYRFRTVANIHTYTNYLFSSSQGYLLGDDHGVQVTWNLLLSKMNYNSQDDMKCSSSI